MSYTPGPWWIEECEGHETIVSKPEERHAHLLKGVHKARYFVLSKRENLVLAAAAPDLIDACKQTLGIMRFRWQQLSTADRVWVAEASERLEVAIAKAEGKP